MQYINATLHLEGGTNPARIWFHIKNITDDGGDPPSDAEQEADPTDTVHNISDQIVVDLFIRHWICGDSCDGGVAAEEWIINETDNLTLRDLECQYINLSYYNCFYEEYVEIFDPCHDIEVSISFHLRGDAGNEYQGDTTTFDIEFYAEQIDGPGP